MSDAANGGEIGKTRPDEVDQIIQVARDAGVFSDEEIATVRELAEDYAARGDASSYHFITYRLGGKAAGFACYGERSLTQGTYDLYWIASPASAQRQGIGRALLERVEHDIHALGGRLVIVETSSLPQYEPARRFYEANEYRREADIADFYADGDGLVIYSKRVDR